MQWTMKPTVLGVYAISTVVHTIGTLGHDHSGHNHSHDHDHDHDHSATTSTEKSTNSTTTPRSIGEAYLYGTLAVVVVSLLSLAGVIVLPFLKRKVIYNCVMLLFMSLAVGTMTSDAVLHLIPETLGLHGHAIGDHSHSHQHDEDDKPFLGKMIAVLGTLYLLYLLEVTAHIVSSAFRKRTAIHDSASKMSASIKTKDENGKVESGHNNPNAIELKTKCEHAHTHGHAHGEKSPSASGDSVGRHSTICGLPSVAFMMTASDALHNFTDGLAIGAAFAKSSAAGLAVSIAVVCHELPHEVGDFAVLINTGMSVKKALLLNFISALTCFLGVYPGIAAGQQDAVRQWIFALVAGGFLYVALVHMIPEIKGFGPLPRGLSLVMQNIGLLLGFTIVLLLAIYEDRLNAVV